MKFKLSSKYKKGIFVGLIIFFVSIIGWAIYFQHNKNDSNNQKKNNNTKVTTKPKTINQFCTINLSYFNSSRLATLKNGYQGLGIKVKTVNNVKDADVIKCKLKDKNIKLLDTLLTNGILKDYLTYTISKNKQNHEYKIIWTGIKDFNYIKNNKITIVKVGSDNENMFLYFKDDPENQVFFRSLQKINQQLALGLKLDIKKVTGFAAFKYKDIKSKFGNDSIITNTKIIIKLAPSDFKLLKEKIQQEKNSLLLKTIENLERVNNIYNNSIVYQGKYIIIKNIKKLIQSVSQK